MTDLGLWETHKMRCDAVQRRGVQLRLRAAISNLTTLGEANLYDTELESLNACRRDLEKVEAAMVAAGQEPYPCNQHKPTSNWGGGGEI